jgi:hypothetical protein
MLNSSDASGKEYLYIKMAVKFLEHTFTQI